MTETGLSIKKQIVVKVPQDFAFNLYADNMGIWWPKEHHIGEAALADVILEKKTGGRWYEKDEDGKECDWGKMLAYDPHSRLLLQWQLNPDFKYDPALYTEVEVLFESLGPEETKVTLEHRKMENFGEHAEKMQRMFDQDNAWLQVLRGYARIAESG